MRRPRAGVVLALAGLVFAAVPAAPHTAAAAPPPPTNPPRTAKLPSGHSWKVTLLTGDVVQVRTVSGRPPLVSVRPGAGRDSVVFRKDVSSDGSVRVIPLDVASRIGRLYDPALFDVTTLIREGNDDAKRSDLPLIVQGGGAAAARTFTQRGRALASIGAVAVRQQKTKGPQLARTAVGDGVRHIWLDRRVRVTALDHNLGQIGAPKAWRAGATGKGVKVAVLDTGVDDTHPDLRGRVAERQNFTDAPDTVDRYGHGTHVAATIAGTGAAANGERRGVAPDADLLIGKVLGDDGSGSASGVIAGMEWAAPRARIVSMSLGGWSEDPANDPMNQAVEKLTDQDGALFVVAAGNSGPGTDSVETPGYAASALTVGAVDGDDQVAQFSSRGGETMKPEISAPGVDIVAARASGTAMGSPVDARYTSASGTSMATPHVAGAAADLLQKHPDWSAARVKAALVSTATAVPGTVYQVGGGRLDVARATATAVAADQSAAAFGSVPHGATDPVTKRLSWTNTGPSPVKLRLAATTADAAGRTVDAVNLPATVTVPAGGSAGVTLSLDPRRLTTAGHYSGAVTAQADGISLRTPVGVSAEPETHTLALKATAIPGTPEGAFEAYATVLNLDNPDLYMGYAEFDANGVVKLPVPEGNYAVFGQVGDTTAGAERAAFTSVPEVAVDGDTTVPLDASNARPLRASAPGTEIDPSAANGLHVERAVGADVFGTGLFAFRGTPSVMTTPTDPVRIGTFRAYATFRLKGDGVVYDLLHDLGATIPAAVDYVPKPSELARIDQRFGALNGNVEAPVHEKRYGVSPTGFLVAEMDGPVPGGSTRTDYVTGEPGVQWLNEAFPPDLGQASWVTQLPIRRYEAGSRQTTEWVRQPFRPGPYSATGLSPSFCAPGPTTRSRGNIHVEMVDLQNLPDGFDCLTGDPEWEAVSSRTMTLYAGNAAVGTVSRSYADFSVPATAGTYRLRYDVDASAVLPVSTKTFTEWTFRSSPSEQRVPLLLVDYALPLNLLNQPVGDTATFTVSRVAGAASAKPTGLKVWTSLDDGTTWQEATVAAATGGRYTARMPQAAKGQPVSLRVRATDSGGSRIDQTILRAYFGA